MIRTLTIPAICLMFAGCGAESAAPPGESAGAAPGAASEPAPRGVPDALPSVVTLTDGEILARLDGLKGTPLLLNFWARWCAPCVAEMPTLSEVAEDMAAAGGRVVAVSMDLMAPSYNLAEAQENTLPFLQEKELALEVWLHATGDHESFVGRFQLGGMGLPTTVAINRAGEVVGTHSGELTRSGFDALVNKALAPR